MLEDLRGKVVLVTGASTGIGAAVAEGFGHCGAKVVVHYNRSQAAAEAVAEAVRRAGGEAIVIQGDVTRKADLARLIDQTVASFGRLDVLVNNAGVVNRRSVIKLDRDEWDRVIAANLTGPFLCTKHAARAMTAQRSGKIINIARCMD